MSLFKKTAVGLDIADHTIEAAEVEYKGMSSRVIALGRTRIKSGIVENGRIKDEKKLAEAIRTVLSKAIPRSISNRTVSFGLPESCTFTHIFKIPTRSKDDIDKLILKEARSSIPLSEDDLVVSYSILSELDSKVEILLVAASRTVIQEWHDFFNKLRIRVNKFDIESLAVFRGLFARKQDVPVCILDIGTISSTINIFDSFGLRYSYSVKKAGSSFTDEISKVLKISFDKAEELKRKDGLLDPNNKIFPVLVKMLEPITKELKESFNYFEKISGKKVEKVVIVGGSSALPDIDNYLSTNLGRTVEVGKSFLGPSKRDQRFYIEAVGLALRFLDKKWFNDPVLTLDGEAVKSRNFNSSYLALILILIIGAGSIWGTLRYKENQKAAKEAEVQKALEEIPEVPIKPVATTTPEKIDEVIILDTPTGWLNVRSGPGTSFDKIGKVSPSEIYPLLEEKDDWYNIQINSETAGWVSGDYSKIKED
ncbi:pilus assembly protein PilM [Patescibacteria group bacterium]